MAAPFARRQPLPAFPDVALPGTAVWRPSDAPASRLAREAVAKFRTALDAALDGGLDVGGTRLSAVIVAMGRDLVIETFREWCADNGVDYSYQPGINTTGQDFITGRALHGVTVAHFGIPHAVTAMNLALKAALVANAAPVEPDADDEPIAECFDSCGTVLHVAPERLARDGKLRCEECLDERLGVERREQWEADREEAGDRAFEGRRDSMPTGSR